MQQIPSVGKGCIAAEKHGRDRVFKADKLARLVLPQCYLHGHTKGKDKTICHFYGGSVYLGINLAKKKLWGENFFHVDIRNLRRKLSRCVIDAYVSERRGTDLG